MPIQATILLKKFFGLPSNTNLATVENGAVTTQNQNFGDFYIEAQNANDPNAIISVGKWFFEIVNFERIVITSSTETNAMLVGQTLALTATYFDAKNVETNADISWSSSNPAVATVDQMGLVTGLTSGSTTITSSTMVNGNPVTQTKLINVVDDIDGVAEIVISSQQNNIMVGGTVTLQATARNISGDNLDNITFTWLSSNTSIATVNDNGLVTGIAVGQAAITASNGSITSENFSITVEAPFISRTRIGTFTNGRGSTNGSVTLF